MKPVYSYFDLSLPEGLAPLLANADAAASELWRDGEPANAEKQIALDGYESDFLVRMTHGSASIEGSTLTLQQTALVLDREFVPKDLKQRDDMLSAMGIADAFRFALRQAEAGRTLDTALIQDTHERIAIDMDESVRGIIRTVPVYIRGSLTVPPDPSMVRNYLDDLVYHCTHTDLHPLVAIAATHKAFESIHPFVDGNGRTGRVLLNFQLATCGYPPIAIDAGSRQRYLESLEAWSVSEDPAPLATLICENVIVEAERRLAIVRA